jgi:hypothetical protein
VDGIAQVKWEAGWNWLVGLDENGLLTQIWLLLDHEAERLFGQVAADPLSKVSDMLFGPLNLKQGSFDQ